MMNRRTALGAGIAFASLTGAAGLAGFGPSRQRRWVEPSIDALLVDETVDMPREVTALIEARGQTVQVIGIRLDAAAHAGLRRVLDRSRVIAGISSGATLFCLERIAWDHGFRVTARSEHCAGSLDGDASRQRLVAVIHGQYASSGSPPAPDRVYRPSRADGILHAWITQKSVRRQNFQLRQEMEL